MVKLAMLVELQQQKCAVAKLTLGILAKARLRLNSLPVQQKLCVLSERASAFGPFRGAVLGAADGFVVLVHEPPGSVAIAPPSATERTVTIFLPLHLLPACNLENANNGDVELLFDPPLASPVVAQTLHLETYF